MPKKPNFAALCLLALALPQTAFAQAPAVAATAPAPAPHYRAEANGMTLSVQAISEGVIRVRIARSGETPADESWAVPAETRAAHAAITPAANGFATALLAVSVDPATLALTVTDREGRIITRDIGPAARFDGTGFTLAKSFAQAEAIHGLGDKTGGFNRRGGRYVNWNTDAYGYDRGTDPVYKSIPFFVSEGGAAGSYGLFLDNTARAWFDFGHRNADAIELGSDMGAVDYYVIAGPTTQDVVRRYTALTGRSPLPPRWAFGYQQSRYSYMTEAEVREVAARLRADRVPTDVLWLDIDFQDRNRPFTTNPQTFPDLGRLAADMREQGIRLVTITDLHIAAAPNEGHQPYDSGAAGDHFLRRADGSPYVAPVWPGASVFPEFTRADTRRWWGDLYAGFVAQGVAGFWNDMNEPAIFETPTKTMPADVVHRIAGDGMAPRTAPHAEIHNVFGMQNARATFEGLERLRPGERPFVMTRASYAGGQRHAVTWTGDNNSTWDHLNLSIQQLVNLGLSGFIYAGADVGGFTGGASPDLLTRWIQVAAFTPVFRVHAAKEAPRTEPWVDGPDHLALRRQAIEARYRLMPYVYAQAEAASRLGDPLMRPVTYDYPAVAAAPCQRDATFTLGSRILVAAAPRGESDKPYGVCLPAGGWFDYWSGKPVEGGTAGAAWLRIEETPRLERLPVFVRAGSLIPTQPLVQSLAETPAGPLGIAVYPGDDCHGEIYWDDGATTAYRAGGHVRQAMRCAAEDQRLRLTLDRREGAFAPWWKALSFTIHGARGPARVTLNRREVAATYDAAAGTLTVATADLPRGGELVVEYR